MTLEPLGLDGASGLGASILIGLFFGIALVKSGFARDESCIRFTALRDGRLIKIFLLTIAFGVVAFYFAARAGIVNIQTADCYRYSAIAGGMVSGVGFALSGFFPGAAVAALGSGRLYALWTVVGMALAIPAKRLLENVISPPWHWGSMTAEPTLASEAFGIANWIWPLAVVAVVLTAIVQVCLPEDEK